MKKNVHGIIIGSTLYENMSYTNNLKLVRIINHALAKEKNSVIELLNFPCGGGAGCYDLGYILTQLINKIGEREFILLINSISKEEKRQAFFLIQAGLEYGDNDYDHEMDNADIHDVFPSLEKFFINSGVN